MNDLESDLVIEVEFTIRFLMSLIASVEFGLVEYILHEDLRPGKSEKFSFSLRPGGHFGESLKCPENRLYLGVFYA